MPVAFPSMPLQEQIIDLRTGAMSRAWIAWFEEYLIRINNVEFEQGSEGGGIAGGIQTGIDDLRSEIAASGNINAQVLNRIEDFEKDFAAIPSLLHRIEELENVVSSLSDRVVPTLPFYLGEAIKIDVDGHITFYNAAVFEKEIELPLSGIGRGATAPTLVRIGSYTGYEFDIGDDGYFEFEVPNEWNGTTDIKIGLHWYCDEDYVTNSGEVQWQGIYACTPERSTEPLDAPTHTDTVVSGDVNIPATAKYLEETYLTIPAAALAYHDIVGVLISRIALVAGANPTAKPTIVSAEVSYYSNKLGEY